MGSGIDNAELMTIGSTPAKDFVHTVNSYGALQTIKNLLAVKACEGESTLSRGSYRRFHASRFVLLIDRPLRYTSCVVSR